MIKVNIAENIELTKATINDMGTLVISMAVSSGDTSLEDSLNDTDTGDTGAQNQDFFIWPFKIGEYTATGLNILDEAKNMKKALTHILEGYLVTNDIKWNLLNGMGIKDVEVDLAKQSNIDKLYENITSQFIEMIEPFLGKGNLFRVKLVRQSKDKHFSTLPKVKDFTSLISDPFWEPMDIKKEASKVHYSPYELGYRKPQGDVIGKLPYSGVDLSNSDATVVESAVSEEDAAAADEMMG